MFKIDQRKKALQENCPKCGSKPGESCVYTWPSNLSPPTLEELSGNFTPHHRDNHVSNTRRQALQSLGTPTNRPHNERFREVDARYYPRNPSKKNEALVALREFDQTELRQMKNWLRDNHTLFRET